MTLRRRCVAAGAAAVQLGNSAVAAGATAAKSIRTFTRRRSATDVEAFSVLPVDGHCGRVPPVTPCFDDLTVEEQGANIIVTSKGCSVPGTFLEECPAPDDDDPQASSSTCAPNTFSDRQESFSDQMLTNNSLDIIGPDGSEIAQDNYHSDTLFISEDSSLSGSFFSSCGEVVDRRAEQVMENNGVITSSFHSTGENRERNGQTRPAQDDAVLEEHEEGSQEDSGVPRTAEQRLPSKSKCSCLSCAGPPVIPKNGDRRQQPCRHHSAAPPSSTRTTLPRITEVQYQGSWRARRSSAHVGLSPWLQGFTITGQEAVSHTGEKLKFVRIDGIFYLEGGALNIDTNGDLLRTGKSGRSLTVRRRA